MKIRIFGSIDCAFCLKVLSWIQKYSLSFIYIDVFDDKTQKLCDDNNVDDLPHVQIIDDKQQVFREFIGGIDENDFREFLMGYFDEIK